MRLLRIAFFATAVIALTAGMAAAQSFAARPTNSGRASLSITSNVPGATVYLNTAQMGSTPVTLTVNPGTYQLTVRATGYNDYSTTVTVNGPTSINAYLQAQNYSLTVTSNINGANVFLNGQRMGQTPMTANLQPGSYNLRVEAGGYQTYSTQVTVNGSMSVNAQLQGQLARIHIRIPEQFLNANSDFGQGNRQRARNDIRVFVDNRRENRDNFEVQQGNHTIRFESGSFQVLQSFYFNAGRDYTISPMLSIRVN